MAYLSEKEWAMKFAKKLASLMESNGHSQNSLAKASGISQSTISNYLSGKQMPTAKAIVAMSYVFYCRTDDLIDFGEPIE